MTMVLESSGSMLDEEMGCRLVRVSEALKVREMGLRLVHGWGQPLVGVSAQEMVEGLEQGLGPVTGHALALEVQTGSSWGHLLDKELAQAQARGSEKLWARLSELGWAIVWGSVLGRVWGLV